MKLTDRIINKLSPIFFGRTVFGSLDQVITFPSVALLVEHHFKEYSVPDHPCRITLGMALQRLRGQEACIVETGSSAWGTNSSLLFDSYVSSFGGHFDTVDIRLEPSIRLRPLCCRKTRLHTDDSVVFLKRWAKQYQNQKIDLLYLDSWDVNWFAPESSALHGLAEFLAISRNLHTGSLLLIDDTPYDASIMERVQPDRVEEFKQFQSQRGFLPGKGALVKMLLEQVGRGRLIAHDYQLLWEF